MGDLILMTPSRAPSLHAPPPNGAEILFFTGVRYYRMEDAMPAVVTPKRRRRPAKVKDVLLPEMQA